MDAREKRTTIGAGGSRVGKKTDKGREKGSFKRGVRVVNTGRKGKKEGERRKKEMRFGVLRFNRYYPVGPKLCAGL